MKSYLEKRQNLIEKNKVYLLPKEKLLSYENSYVYKKSKYNNFDALKLERFPIIKDFPLIYNDRIFFFENEEIAKRFSEEPKKYLKLTSIPNDINYNPIVFIIGLQKTGKSSLSKKYTIFIFNFYMQIILKNFK